MRLEAKEPRGALLRQQAGENRGCPPVGSCVHTPFWKMVWQFLKSQHIPTIGSSHCPLNI